MYVSTLILLLFYKNVLYLLEVVAFTTLRPWGRGVTSLPPCIRLQLEKGKNEFNRLCNIVCNIM